MLDEKDLQAHPDKTCYIVTGSRKYKERVNIDLERSKVMLGDFPVKKKECDRYLGQMLHGGGLDRSAEATAQERVGRLKGATREIKGIIEEFQMQTLGGMMAAWELWERALIPSLLSGAGTWFGGGDSKKVVEICDGIQNYFWRVMLTVPESCPKIALRCETGMMGMKWRIWKEKIMLVVRIKDQDSSVLSRQVYEESLIRGWPGLGKEVSGICLEIGIPDVNKVVVTKEDIREAIWNHHYRDMKIELEKSKKLGDIKHEDFSEVQNYFKVKSVETTRMAFKVRAKMISEIPENFKNKYKEEGLKCVYCNQGEISSQSHCMVCPAWGKCREGLDLTNILDLVVFFRKVLDERAKLDAKNVLGTAMHDSCIGLQ